MRPDRVIAELETDDAGLSTLLNHLIAQGVQMRSFYDRDPTLEDVFMSVTEGLVS
jgi:ABC-2 type transport system ATP-binding protein